MDNFTVHTLFNNCHIISYSFNKKTHKKLKNSIKMQLKQTKNGEKNYLLNYRLIIQN